MPAFVTTETYVSVESTRVHVPMSSAPRGMQRRVL